jgi:hypothetical protein
MAFFCRRKVQIAPPAASPVLLLQFLVWFGLYSIGLRYRLLNLMLVLFFFVQTAKFFVQTSAFVWSHKQLLCNCVLNFYVVNMLVQTVGCMSCVR